MNIYTDLWVQQNQFKNSLCNANNLNAKLNEFKLLNPFSWSRV